MSIYVRDADGNRHKIAGVGLPGPPGKSAYQYAVEGGFSGTEEEFRAVVGVRSNPNLLDNGYLADPINQRGQTEYAEGGYAVDRWTSSKMTVHDGYVTFENDLIQSFEWERFAILMGSIVTLSYLNNKNELIFSTGHIPNQFEPTGLQAVYLGPFTMYIFPGSSVQVFRLDRSDTIIAAKLELGPVQTLAHKDAFGNWVLNDPPPNKALELAKCQRYQLCVRAKQAYSMFGFAYGFDQSKASAFIPAPCNFTKNPSVVKSDDFELYSLAGSTIPVTDIRFDHWSTNGVRVWVYTDASTITPGALYQLRSSRNANAFILFDANL